jgi:predicted lysophospholipase L1 biosynthesis ABC-type transport system permease subunit
LQWARKNKIEIILMYVGDREKEKNGEDRMKTGLNITLAREEPEGREVVSGIWEAPLKNLL